MIKVPAVTLLLSARGEEINSALHAVEVHSPKNFGDAMRVYLDMAVQDALASSDPLVKAFAIVDRRMGKRTLEKLNLSDDEHSLVKMFYGLRKAVGDT